MRRLIWAWLFMPGLVLAQSTRITGPNTPGSTTINTAVVKSPSTAAATTDPSWVCQLNPSQPNLTTPLNTLDTKLPVAQGATLGTNAGPLIQGVYLASNPSYSAGTINPIRVTSSGRLLTSSLAEWGWGSALSGSTPMMAGAQALSAAPSYSNDQVQPFSLTLAGGLRVDDSHTTAAAPLSCRLTDGSAFYSLNFPAQGSTTAGQLGPLVQGAVTTSAPSYATGQTSPLSLTLGGDLRVQANAGTGPGQANGWFVRLTDGVDTASITVNGLMVDSGTLASENTVSAISGKLPAALGQTTMANSLSVAIASNQGAVSVSGPLTDTQLRATAVPVSGTVTANAGTGTMAVSGPLTDSQLRATAVPVSGTVTTSPPSNASTNIAQLGGQNVINGGVTGAFAIGGPGAHAAAIGSGNPVQVGAYAEAEGAAMDQSNVAAGDLSRLKTDLSGRLLVRHDHPNRFVCRVSGQTTMVNLTCSPALPGGASVYHYVDSVILSNGPTAQTLKVIASTTTACGGSPTDVTSTVYLGINGGAAQQFPTPIKIGQANSYLCLQGSGNTAASATVTGFLAP